MRRFSFYSLLLFFSTQGFAAPVKKEVVVELPSSGMVIRGDQEAPLVLYIVPWKEPGLPKMPEAYMEPLLPKVLDYDRSLVDDPLNQASTIRLNSSEDQK